MGGRDSQLLREKRRVFRMAGSPRLSSYERAELCGGCDPVRRGQVGLKRKQLRGELREETGRSCRNPGFWPPSPSDAVDIRQAEVQAPVSEARCVRVRWSLRPQKQPTVCISFVFVDLGIDPLVDCLLAICTDRLPFRS
jgi:hypothetical protein